MADLLAKAAYVTSVGEKGTARCRRLALPVGPARARGGRGGPRRIEERSEARPPQSASPQHALARRR